MAADLVLKRDADFWETQASPLFPVSRSGKVKPCPHCQMKRRRMLFVIAIILGLIAGALTAWLARPAPAYTTTHHATLDSYVSPGNRLLNAAETRAGDWYSYGATGPVTFDCSGLVYWSAGDIGLRNWPRDTFSLIAAVASGRLSYTSHPQRGDLAFFGTGHVEIVTIWYHTTFGAQQTGTRVGWHKWNGWWHPTFYLHINW